MTRWFRSQRPTDRPRIALGSQSGSALLIAVMVLATISILGVAMVYNSRVDRQMSSFEKDSMDALAAAESGIAIAKRAVQDMVAPLGDADHDGRPDFTLSDTLSWGGTYTVVGEAGEIRDIDLSAYRSDGFTIVAEGRSRGAVRRVRVELAHDSFLKYARFVEATGTSYSCGGILTGEIFVGGDLAVPTCSSGEEVTFLEFVAAAGDIPNAASGVFMRGYVTDAPEIDLGDSVDFDEMRDRARGVAFDNSCDGVGVVGFYESPSTGWDPIGIAGTGNVLDLKEFDFHDTWSSPGDTVISYNNSPTTNVMTGGALRSRDFNGIIFFQGDGHIKGTLDGVSAHSMTVFCSRNVIIDDWIVTGFTGFDPGTREPNLSGDPVNIGLVARDYVLLGPVPRICRIDAALMAVTANWRAQVPYPYAHAPYLTGPVDLDMDGIIGETPVNHDPEFGTGWDEVNLTSNHWVLNINGPIITHDGGSASPWSSPTIAAGAPGPTRRYNYDLDITQFPPSCFPVPLNLWVDVSWTEIPDGSSDLASFLSD